MKKRIFLGILLFVSFLPIFCSENTTLTVLLKNNEEKSYSITNSGKIYFDDINLYIQQNQSDISSIIQLSLIRKILVTKETGLAENAEETNKYSIYPNPTQDYLYLSGIPENGCVFHIISISGQISCIKHISEGEIIDVRELNPGFYLLQVDGECFKFIKQ
ncbi:MAG: T9SS type A sorting domain-containing protein [Bacteroidia bacterium]|nr:T9SS type A sorting domain-containing protein [Bacteroidia bacterium]